MFSSLIASVASRHTNEHVPLLLLHSADSFKNIDDFLLNYSGAFRVGYARATQPGIRGSWLVTTTRNKASRVVVLDQRAAAAAVLV